MPASEITAKNPDALKALKSMPALFTLAEYREAMGVRSYGPDWSACASTLQAFKRAGMIAGIPGGKAWKKIY